MAVGLSLSDDTERCRTAVGLCSSDRRRLFGDAIALGSYPKELAALEHGWRLTHTQPKQEDPRVVSVPRSKVVATTHAHAVRARNTRNAAASINFNRGVLR
jgi:hypothetical protein